MVHPDKKELWHVSKADTIIIAELLNAGEIDVMVSGMIRALVIFDMKMPGFFDAYSEIVKRVNFIETQRYATIDELIEDSPYFKDFHKRTGYHASQYFASLFEKLENTPIKSKEIVEFFSTLQENAKVPSEKPEPKYEMYPSGEVQRKIDEMKQQQIEAGKGGIGDVSKIINFFHNQKGFVNTVLGANQNKDEPKGKESEGSGAQNNGSCDQKGTPPDESSVEPKTMSESSKKSVNQTVEKTDSIETGKETGNKQSDKVNEIVEDKNTDPLESADDLDVGLSDLLGDNDEDQPIDPGIEDMEIIPEDEIVTEELLAEEGDLDLDVDDDEDNE